MAKPRARLWANGTEAVEWGLVVGSATDMRVPIGRWTLSVFSVYMSDTIVCSDNTNGAPGQTCLQPTAGKSLTCDLPIVVNEAATTQATYEILASGRCRLDPGQPAEQPTGAGDPAPSDAGG